jgi:predicted RNA methylase
MGDAVLDNEVIDVLSRAECLGSALRLPPGQLDRKLYERVNKALTNAGGKWNKSAKAHLFTVDAAPKLAAMLGTGVAVDERKLFQTFFTPDAIARQAAEWANVLGFLVLEPSAGRGAIADACMEAGASDVHCYEINPEFVDDLLAKEYPTTAGDFLQFNSSSRKYDRIVMNPPFTRNQDIAHVRHALTFLNPGGVLVSIMLNNQTRKGFVDLNVEYEPEIDEIPRGAFKGSGTEVATIMIRIELQ